MRSVMLLAMVPQLAAPPTDAHAFPAACAVNLCPCAPAEKPVHVLDVCAHLVAVDPAEASPSNGTPAASGHCVMHMLIVCPPSGQTGEHRGAHCLTRCRVPCAVQ
jgi:hypothetical protein